MYAVYLNIFYTPHPSYTRYTIHYKMIYTIRPHESTYIFTVPFTVAPNAVGRSWCTRRPLGSPRASPPAAGPLGRARSLRCRRPPGAAARPSPSMPCRSSLIDIYTIIIYIYCIHLYIYTIYTVYIHVYHDISRVCLDICMYMLYVYISKASYHG